MRRLGFALLAAMLCGGCSVVAVTDAVIDVAATTVKVGAKVVETTVDLASSGIKAMKDDPKPEEKAPGDGKSAEPEEKKETQDPPPKENP